MINRWPYFFDDTWDIVENATRYLVPKIYDMKEDNQPDVLAPLQLTLLLLESTWETTLKNQNLRKNSLEAFTRRML